MFDSSDASTVASKGVGAAEFVGPVVRPVRPLPELPSIRVRLHAGLPLLLLGSVLLGGAWAASADRLRIFSWPYPVWILLAMNATVILGAAFVGAFIREPSTLAEDDPELVHIPRARWESIL